MPYTTTAKPEGCPVAYRLGANAKKYTFRDLGFMETKQGNFQLIRALDPTPQMKVGFKLKITVSADLTGLKMSIVTNDGMRAVNIFDKDDADSKMIQEKFFFIMTALLQRECLEEVK